MVRSFWNLRSVPRTLPGVTTKRETTGAVETPTTSIGSEASIAQSITAKETILTTKDLNLTGVARKGHFSAVSPQSKDFRGV